MKRQRPLSEIGKGVRLLVFGFGIVFRTPRLLFIGALPAILTTLLLLGGLVTLIVFVDELAGLLTPFADSWSEGWRTLIRVVVGLAMLGGAVVLSVLVFAVLTLLIGGPFYERIAAHVDASLDAAEGAVEAAPAGDGTDPPWWNEAADSARVLLRSLLYAVGLLVLGMLPLAGQSVVPVVSACVAGWLLAVELVGVAFSRRGLGLDDRRRALRSRRLLTLSFGVPTYLLCLVPLLAIVVMPAAVAGGTLLAREVLRTPSATR